ANGNSDGEAVVDESEPAEYSDSHGTWTGDSGGVHCRAGARTAGRGLFADRTAIAGTLLKGQAAGGGVSTRRRHSHADRVAGVWRAAVDGYSGSPAAGEGGELRNCLRFVSVWAVAEFGH